MQTKDKILMSVIIAALITGIYLTQPAAALAYSGPSAVTSYTNTQRTLGTVYQNTGNTTMFVYVSMYLESPGSTTNEVIGSIGTTNTPNVTFGVCEGIPKAYEAQPCTMLLIVPPGDYYQIVNETSHTVQVLSWTEAN